MTEELTKGSNSEEEGCPEPPAGQTALGRRIQWLRRRKGLERSELAERLGVSRQRVGNWERGGNTPSVASLPALARELGVTIDELVTGEPPRVAGLSPEALEEAGQHLEALRELLRSINPREK